jgi:hypothetical protein
VSRRVGGPRGRAEAASRPLRTHFEALFRDRRSRYSRPSCRTTNPSPPPAQWLVAVPVTVTAPWWGMSKDSGVGSAQANGGLLLGPTSTVSLLGCSWLPLEPLAILRAPALALRCGQLVVGGHHRLLRRARPARPAATQTARPTPATIGSRPRRRHRHTATDSRVRSDHRGGDTTEGARIHRIRLHPHHSTCFAPEPFEWRPELRLKARWHTAALAAGGLLAMRRTRR